MPQNDYPVLDSQLFVLIWIDFTLDARIFTMRGLFFLLDHLGFRVDISNLPFVKSVSIVVLNHFNAF